MEIIIEHLRTNAAIYISAVVLSLPVIYLTRKYSVPFILYSVEAVIYFGLMHAFMCGLVGATRWFKENSSMKALRADGRPADAPEWSTPLLEFWDLEKYQPGWLVYVEVVLVLLILIGMWRYRPMKVQRKSRRKTQDYKGMGKRPGAGKPGAAAKKYSASRGRR